MTMRIIRLTLLLLGLTAGSAVMAQFSFIKTDVLGPFVNNPFQLSFERNFDSPNSMVIAVEGGWYMRDVASKNGQPYWDKQITGYGGILEYRRYLQYNGRLSRPVGLFTGIFARGFAASYVQDFSYAFNNLGEVDQQEDFLMIGGGALLGYKYKRPYNPLFFEVLGGLGWGYGDIQQYSPDDLPDKYLLWRWEVGVGVSF